MEIRLNPKRLEEIITELEQANKICTKEYDSNYFIKESIKNLKKAKMVEDMDKRTERYIVII